jgi:membrane protein required for colicin V production
MMGAWNWLDWTLAGVVLLSVLTAFVKGFIRELISLAALVAGLAVATLGYERAASWFDDLTRSHQAAQGLGFLVLFLGTLLVGAVFSILAGKLIKTAGLQRIDRLLGVGFGLIRGVAIDCVLVLAMIAFAIKPDALKQSVLAPYVTTGADAIAEALPAPLRTQFRTGLEKAKQTLGQNEKRKKD